MMNHFAGFSAVTSLYHIQNDYKNYLLIGSGGVLELINLDDNHSLSRLPIFKDCSTHQIHGIFRQSQHLFLIFGGKTLKSVQIDFQNDCLIEEKTEIESQLQDWILDAQVFQGRIYAITAHNNVLILSQRKNETINKCSDEKCILYSATLVAEEEELVVLGGTVFKQVIVWTCNQGDFKLHHRLEGHEGVIFSVQYDSKLSLICSTSDDRSARSGMPVIAF